MNSKKIIAFVYDFDKTLTPKNMQDYGFFNFLKVNDNDFWKQSAIRTEVGQMDNVLAYMYETIIELNKQNRRLKREDLVECGRCIKYFPGVETWFDRINQYVEEQGFKAEHYVISAGIKEILEGCSIYNKFDRVMASEYHYDDNGYADWPKVAINYTVKTQYLFRINKKIFTIKNNDDLNRAMKEEDRHVPFDRMIYIGDGFSDVPAMKLVRSLGGHSIAVVNDKSSDISMELVKEGRIDYICNPNYEENSELDEIVKTIIKYIARKGKYNNGN